MKGRIKQSLVYWCYNVAGDQWDIEKMCQVAKDLGCKSIELADPELWPTIKKHGLTNALAPNGMPGAPFMRGFNNPAYQPEVITRTAQMIDACAEAGFPRERTQADRRPCGEEGRDNLPGASQHPRQQPSDEGPSRLSGR
jgi:hypothetical protein